MTEYPLPESWGIYIEKCTEEYIVMVFDIFLTTTFIVTYSFVCISKAESYLDKYSHYRLKLDPCLSAKLR